MTGEDYAIETKADAIIHGNYDVIRLGFELTATDDTDTDTGYLMNVVSENHRALSYYAHTLNNDTVTQYAFIEITTTPVTKVLWKYATELMAARERNRFLTYASHANITVRLLKSTELHDLIKSTTRNGTMSTMRESTT